MLKKIKDVKNATCISKQKQTKLNGGIFPVVECKGIITISPDGTCPSGQRLINECFCCDD